VPSWRVGRLLIFFSGLASGVAKGSCGVDLVCLPLEATTEKHGVVTVELPGAQLQYSMFQVLMHLKNQ
jgi:hypothetical protein